ncbi:hypothetical protein AAY473_022654 [Plecturocebus cupreus]
MEGTWVHESPHRENRPLHQLSSHRLVHEQEAKFYRSKSVKSYAMVLQLAENEENYRLHQTQVRKSYCIEALDVGGFAAWVMSQKEIQQCITKVVLVSCTLQATVFFPTLERSGLIIAHHSLELQGSTGTIGVYHLVQQTFYVFARKEVSLCCPGCQTLGIILPPWLPKGARPPLLCVADCKVRPGVDQADDLL